MKKMIAILLTLSLVLGIAACGSTGAASTTSAEPAQAEVAAEPAPEATPEAAPEAIAEAEPAAESAEAEPAEADPAKTEATDPSQTEAVQAEPTTEPTELVAAVNPVGGYKLTNLTTGSGNDMEVISTVVDMGASYYLILEEDGTGRMNFLEAEIPLTWDDTSLVVEPRLQEQSVSTLKLPYTYADGHLQINTKAYSMEFTSLSDAEFDNYRSNGAGSLFGMLSQVASPLLGNLDELPNMLFFLLAQGSYEEELEPIPEGEPSEGIVNGRLGDLEINVVGTAHIKGDEDRDLIVLYFDVTNHSETEVISSWMQVELDAAQDGESLTEVYDYDRVPEIHNYDFGIAPGMTLRCADSYRFDPEGGVVGFRFTSLYADGTIFYYADPANLVAPAEPFVIGADPWVASFLENVPEETGDLSVESMEFDTDENGQKVLKVLFRFVNTTGTDGGTFHNEHGCYALQDGYGLNYNYNGDAPEEESHVNKELAAGEETLVYRAYVVRTDSPITFVIYNDSTEQRIPVMAKVVEVGE